MILDFVTVRAACLESHVRGVDLGVPLALCSVLRDFDERLLPQLTGRASSDCTSRARESTTRGDISNDILTEGYGPEAKCPIYTRGGVYILRGSAPCHE